MEVFGSGYPMCDQACAFECYGMCGFEPVAAVAPHSLAWAMASVVPPL